ncbi:MAG: hypothetical protein LBT92_02980 [Rickettsiales bacterium]|nr:hypothetical protein [Rickettsiales bacterium]
MRRTILATGMLALTLLYGQGSRAQQVSGVKMLEAEAGPDLYDEIKARPQSEWTGEDWMTLALILDRLSKAIGVKPHWIDRNALADMAKWPRARLLTMNETLQRLDDLVKTVREMQSVLRATCDEVSAKSEIISCPEGSAYPTGYSTNGSSTVYKCLKTPNGNIISWKDGKALITNDNSPVNENLSTNPAITYCYAKMIVQAKETETGFVPVSPDEVECPSESSGHAFNPGVGRAFFSRDMRIVGEIILEIRDRHANSKNAGIKSRIDAACRNLLALVREVRKNYSAYEHIHKDEWNARLDSIVDEINKLDNNPGSTGRR